MLAFGVGIKGGTWMHRLSGTHVSGLMVMIALASPWHAIANHSTSRFGFLNPIECKIEHEYVMATVLPAVNEIIRHGDLSDFRFINEIFRDYIEIEPPDSMKSLKYTEEYGSIYYYDILVKDDNVLDASYSEHLYKDEDKKIDKIQFNIYFHYAGVSTDCQSIIGSEVLAAIPAPYMTHKTELKAQTDGGHDHSEIVTYPALKSGKSGISVSWGYEHTDQIHFSQLKN